MNFHFISEEHKAALKFSIMDQLNLSDGEDLPQEILEKMKKMPVPDELLNFLETFEQLDISSFFDSLKLVTVAV